MPKALRLALAPVLGVVLCIALGLLVSRPALGDAERARTADRFGFSVQNLNSAPPDARYMRPVAPALWGLRAWISAVGAAVGLADLSGQGRATDACLVDPRDDSVTVRPVPGAGGPAYAPFKLHPTGLPYDATMAPMGCVPADLDEDGDQDIIVYYWGRSPVLFVNTAGATTTPTTGTFRAVEMVVPMQVWNSTGLNVADVDGDGHLDVMVANYFPDEGKVLDPDITNEARIAMQDSMALAANAGMNRLYLARPTGQPDTLPVLTDASTAIPERAGTSWTLAIGFQDLTGDHLPEVYLANDFGPDHLLVNHSTPGKARFEAVVGDRDMVTPKSLVLGRDSFKGMGITYTYDRGSELPMMVVSNITHNFGLHESNFAFVPDGKGEDLLRGKVPFRNDSEQLGLSRSGWGWDIKSGDFDNDGVDELVQATGFIKGEVNRWPLLQELAMGNDGLTRFPVSWPVFGPGDDLSGHQHNPFWIRGSDGRYTDLAKDVGLGAQDVSRGLAFGDVNGDGKLDMLVANQWEDSRVLINEGPAGPGVALRLEMPAGTGTRPAIGAKIEVHDPEGVRRTQFFPANGHAGVSAAEVSMALPSAGSTPATITWRAGTTVHRAEVQLTPGRHTILLTPNGTAELR
ncbi:FG-GAP repeat domain-containing protein [Polymorphospora rubra]|uniref:RNA-binding protein n=1 Tax=Polymorphospora rubra TaxID=338584 RepID=A0A810N4L6_9ACTN|nr:VCBS repeat-containing protein [Polymorphospora rubra]BCJ66643.1 RNA-binding protein [Polymorphospora rubra]